LFFLAGVYLCSIVVTGLAAPSALLTLKALPFVYQLKGASLGDCWMGAFSIA
jgi:hypothetical protein